MNPDLVAAIEKLVSMGGQAGMLLLATYYLARVLKNQYDSRITDLEARSAKCEEHRLELTREIRVMQGDRITILERLIEKGREDKQG